MTQNLLVANQGFLTQIHLQTQDPSYDITTKDGCNVVAEFSQISFSKKPNHYSGNFQIFFSEWSHCWTK